MAQGPSGARDTLFLVKSEFITTSDGVRIHYLEAGKGPAMVFIPGWQMWIWEKQIAHFSAKYHVIAADPRSQGESDKPADGNYPERRARDYKELVDHLKLTPAVLVGWSMGVPEIMAYVDQFGAGDLSGVVLVDGFVKVEDDVAKVFPRWLKSLEMDRKGFTDRFVHNMYKKPQPESYYQRLTAAALQTPTNSAVTLGVSMIARTDWSPVFPKLAKTPVLCVVTTVLVKQLDPLRAAFRIFSRKSSRTPATRYLWTRRSGSTWWWSDSSRARGPGNYVAGSALPLSL
jgi:non-heme chloroperoxidase